MGHEVDEGTLVEERDPHRAKSKVVRGFLERKGKFEYVRRGPLLRDPVIGWRRQRKKKGVLLAYPVGQDVVIGWSLCHWKLDDFSSEQGVMIALDRALTWKEKSAKAGHAQSPNMASCRARLAGKVPQSIRKELFDFTVRMKQYYKGKLFPGWVESLQQQMMEAAEAAEALSSKSSTANSHSLC